MAKKARKKTKLPKAEQLPSGNYRVRICKNGIKKTFIAETAAEALDECIRWLGSDEAMKKNVKNLKLGDEAEEYINSRDNTNAGSGIRSYKVIRKNSIGEIENIKINDITEHDLQKWVNNNSKNYAPKSVKTQFGFVTAVLRYFKIKLDFESVRLPDIPPNDRPYPTEKEIPIILDLVKGTSIEIPVTLTLSLGMRQGEVAGLKWEDYTDNYLFVRAEYTLNKDGRYEYQERTKSSAGFRKIEVTDNVKEMLDKADRISEFISPMLPSSVLKAYHKILRDNGLPEYRMHDNRHSNATIMHAYGVPDKYAMQRLGQSSNSMLKRVYQHLEEEKIKETSKLMSDIFNNLSHKTKSDINE